VNNDDLTIEWKADRIIVTVRGQVYVSAVEDEEGDDELLLMDDDGEDIDDDDIDGDDDEGDDDDELMNDNEDEEEDEIPLVDRMMNEDSPTESSTEVDEGPPSPRGVDVAALARAINGALDDGGIGLLIAETHEIEVTTPGASEELQGRVMFEAYKGFDVICQQMDLKTKKVKQVEGRLVERNDEFTILNIKGRMKKLKNNTVLSVKLPKAKKEKGGK
jgi:ribosome maturation factor RimP